jgi:hypothetical protein
MAGGQPALPGQFFDGDSLLQVIVNMSIYLFCQQLIRAWLCGGCGGRVPVEFKQQQGKSQAAFFGTAFLISRQQFLKHPAGGR